jgi:tetratricopeptide (TPR) repeat protein
MMDWFSREQRYLRILAVDPKNNRVMRSLGQMLHSVGRCRESLAVVERAIAIEPLSPDHQVRKALRLWVIGRVADADPVIDRAMELWPAHRLVRLARLMIYAFTGRTQAALALVKDEEARPILLSPAAASIWRTALAALEGRSPSTIAAAREAMVEGSKNSTAVAAWAILVLSALDELDASFEVANGFLLGRGSVIVRPPPEVRTPSVNNRGWRNTFGLFTPPTKAMRLDPRFKALCDGLGLTEYWRKRGIGPDAFLMRP